MLPLFEERFRLARERDWPAAIIAAYYDLPESFVSTMAGEVRGLRSDGAIDRFLFEKALVSSKIVGLTWIGLDFGLPREELERVMQAPPPTYSPIP